MKIMNRLFALVCFCIAPLVISSCHIDPDAPYSEPYDAGEFGRPKFEAESALYKISSGESDLSSIELTASGYYIVIKKTSRKLSSVNGSSAGLFDSRFRSISTRSAKSIISGTYKKTGNGVYVLDGFGTIVIKGGDNNSISLDITTNNGNKVEVGAMKADQYESSTKTNALCRTWDLGKVLVHSPSGDLSYANMLDYLKGEKHIEEEDDYPTNIIFTQSGTYVVLYSNKELAVSTWAWENEATGRARYSWDYSNIYSGDIIDIVFEGRQALVTEYFSSTKSVTYYLSETK